MIRHSIKLRIMIMLGSMIALLVGVLLLFNNTLSEKFYLHDKQETMIDSYTDIDKTLQENDAGTLSSDDMSNRLDQLTSANSISVIIVSSDWSTVYANLKGEQDMVNRLRMSIFNSDVIKDDSSSGNSGSSQDTGGSSDSLFPSVIQQPSDAPTDGSQSTDDGDSDSKKKDIYHINMSESGAEESREIISKNDSYTLQKVYDSRLDDYYYELLGTLQNGDSVLIRLPLQSINDNVAITNTFIRFGGLGILVLGLIVAYTMASFITKPIKQLSSIAERMSELDFDAHYTGKDKSEIGLLGTSMNDMSRKLEENISQLKSANLELQRDIDRKIQIDEMRKDFLSNVSHELKTPIALIQGYAEGLKEGISDDPESMEFYCDVIMDEANKMNIMVKKLLTLNQIEFGNEELVMDRFDIIELLSSVVHANELRASQKDIQIEFKQDGQHMEVWSDEYKIEEVITNYISNAINHCDFEKKIQVWAEKNGTDVRVHVFNTGKPIPDADIDNIWIKFYKVDKARTREYGGNGIGLSIVKAIMDSYGKQCGVINRENGVEFWFDVDATNKA